jgi:heme-degrading monooxygenase HmoA
MDAVKSWHSQADHMASQTEARASGLFKDFRIRVADVVRDYGL